MGAIGGVGVSGHQGGNSSSSENSLSDNMRREIKKRKWTYQRPSNLSQREAKQIGQKFYLTMGTAYRVIEEYVGREVLKGDTAYAAVGIAHGTPLERYMLQHPPMVAPEWQRQADDKNTLRYLFDMSRANHVKEEPPVKSPVVARIVTRYYGWPTERDYRFALPDLTFNLVKLLQDRRRLFTDISQSTLAVQEAVEKLAEKYNWISER